MAIPERTRRGEYASPEAGSPEVEAAESSNGWVKKTRPSGKFFKFTEIGDSIEGELKSFFESTYEGKTHKNALLLTERGEVSFRLSQQLNQYFDGVEIGSKVRIVYKGKQGKMKSFDFYVAE